MAATTRAPQAMRLAALILLLSCALTAPAGAQKLAALDDLGEGDYDVAGNLKIADPVALLAKLEFGRQERSGDRYLLTLSGKQAAFSAQIGGQIIPLGLPGKLPALKAGQVLPFTVQRRGWCMAFVLGERVLSRAYDRRLGDGKIAAGATGGQWLDIRVQPVGDIGLQDDFVREAGADSAWQPKVGAWEQKTLRDDQQAGREEADKSANAFSYSGSGEPYGLTLAGSWFWDRYALQVAVKPSETRAVGVACYCQDAKNFLALRWTSALEGGADGNCLQLIAVRDGKAQVIKQAPGGFRPDQWYALRVEVCNGQVRGLIDGELRLQARTDLWGQGMMGLYVEGKAGAFFDDVLCVEWDRLADDFSTKVPGKWQMGPGWDIRKGSLAHSGTEASVCVGGRKWQACLTTVQAGSSGTTGIVAAYQSSKQYCLLRWTPPVGVPAARALVQLVKVEGGKSTVLATTPFVGGGPVSARLTIMDGFVRGEVGDKVRLQAIVPWAKEGLVGVYATGRASIDALEVCAITPPRGSHVAKEFGITEKHPEMGEWASTRAAWQLLKPGDTTWWTKSEYFGDTAVVFKLPVVGSRNSNVRTTLGADPGSPEGVTLALLTRSGTKSVTVQLLRGSRMLATSECPVDGEAEVSLARFGPTLLVKINGKIVAGANL